MQYKEWITIQISHAFFIQEGLCGIELIPYPATDSLLKKANVLWRQKEPDTWLLIKTEAENEEVDQTTFMLEEGSCDLKFWLKPQSATFGYYTRMEEMKDNCWEIIRNKEAPIVQYYLQISVDMQLICKTEEINIQIPTKEVYWAFILVPKHSNKSIDVELIEDNNKLKFTLPEKCEGESEKFAVKSTTVESIAMKEKYGYQISLWEKKNNGEKVLLYRQIPIPRIESLSSDGDKKLITSYVYY